MALIFMHGDQNAVQSWMKEYRMRRYAVALALTSTLALSACGSGSETAKDTSSGDAAAPVAETSPTGPSLASAPIEWGQCATCHTIKPGVNAVGPSLFGVFGKKSASVEGYAYSEAMKAAGKTWDEATLDTYLTAPMKDVPGTKMTYAGMTDPAKRKAVIDFLKTVK